MIARLGGALWTAVLALSAIITIVGALKLPEFVDSSNPWVLLGGAVIVFAIGFGNGYKQGKVRNEISAETEERIAQMRLDHEAERRRLDADAAAERQRLKDESDARIRREDEEIRKTTQAETIRLNMFAALSKAEADVVRKIADSSDGMTYVHNDELVISLMKKKVAYTTSQYGGTVPVMLTEAWQLIMNTHRDEFEAVRKLVKDDK